MHIELLGIIYKIFSMLGYSTIALINKGVIKNLNTFQVFFASSLSCLAFTIAIIKIKRKESLLHIAKSLDRTYLIISVINFVSVCATLYAIKTLDITIVISIGFLTPILTHVLALLIFKEQFSVKASVALLISILGAFIIVTPVTTSSTTILGIITALISAIGWSMHNIILKKQTMKDHWTKQTFLTLILTSSISLPFAISIWEPLTNYTILIFFVLGFLYTISKMFLVKGINRTPLTLLAPIGLMKLTFNASLAYLFFNEIISTTTIIGSILIILATIIVMRSTKRNASSVIQTKKK